MEGSPQDPQDPQEQPDANGNLPLDERVKVEGLAIFARRQMVTDGKIDPWKVADEIEPTVVRALVRSEGERSNRGITPTGLMTGHFSEVPRREDYEGDDDGERQFVDAVYGYVKGQVFRVLNVAPDGPIQSRLATNGDGLVLCRMKGRRGAEEVAYVTKSRKCIDLDNNGPAFRRALLAQRKADALTGMSMERLPEDAKWFERRAANARKELVDGSKNAIRAALEAGDGTFDDGDDASDE